jgi:hypothetical protein
VIKQLGKIQKLDDHVCVIATRDGFDVEEHDHD